MVMFNPVIVKKSAPYDTEEGCLSLTGTPFRSDDNPIPFVAYDELAPGVKQSRADYTYGYSEALSDSVVRPVLFMNYGGPMRWRTTSNSITAAAAETLSDSILPIIGIASCSSQSFSTSFEMPVSSAPITSAVGLRKSAS